MKLTQLITSLILSLSIHSIAQDRSEWFQFYLPWDDSTETITDLSGFLDAPAGKHGFLEVTPDGHFKFENSDENIRFIGVNQVAKACFPNKDEAQKLAARMAKFGINLVRLHLVDVEWDNGLFQNSQDNSIEIHEGRLDQMDYFIHCLKQKGIYFNFCIQAGRVFKTNDGIDATINNNQSKYSTLFNEKLIELQKDFAYKILSHTNPHTGLSYANDPAMANLELTNENSLFNGWLGWQDGFLFTEDPNGIGEFYATELDSLFNDWLSNRYPNNDSLAKAWSVQSLSGNEMVENGSFENDFNQWSPYLNTSDGAQGEFTIEASEAYHGSKSCKASISSAGTENWHIQIKTNKFSIEQGKSYKIEFYLKADTETTISTSVLEDQTWAGFGTGSYNTTTDWKKYENYFAASRTVNENIFVQFEFGLVTGNFWLDSVSISEYGGEGLESDENLTLKNIKRTAASEFGKYSKTRIGDNARFYFDLEGSYITELSGYCKNELGIKVPITFTNNYYGLASIYSQSRADYMDTHLYWDHPHFPNGWSDTDFTLNNESMLLDPQRSTINNLQHSKVKGKPILLSEYNHAYPYIYQSEASPLLFAYGSFMDFDGIYYHAYYDFHKRFDQVHQDMFFDIAMNPIVMVQYMLSVPYRTYKLQEAPTPVKASYKEDDIFNNTGQFQDDGVVNIEGSFQSTMFLEKGFEHESFKGKSTELSEEFYTSGNNVTTNTNEIFWNGNNGIVTINNDYWQGAVGFFANETINLNHFTISEMQTTDGEDFASLNIVSLDGLPFDESKKMILTATARLENEGLKWNSNKTRLTSLGGNKALCEPVRASISFEAAVADSFAVYQLDERGNRIKTLESTVTDGKAEFIIDEKTLWYEISNHSQVELIQTIERTGYYNNDIIIYPNPVNDRLTIESINNLKLESISLFDLNGKQLIEEQVISATKGRITLSSINNGFYFVDVVLSDGTHVKNKIIKADM